MKGIYKITVSEPWNYESIQGENIIIGHILKIVSDQCVIYQSSSLLEFGNINGNRLVLFPRFKEDKFHENLNKVSINGGLLLIDFLDFLDETNLEQNSKFVIIGTLEKHN